MKIKKYLAPTLEKAIEQMRTELGKGAIVLGSRVIEQSDSENMFELTAAYERQLKERGETVSKVAGKNETFFRLDSAEDEVLTKPMPAVKNKKQEKTENVRPLLKLLFQKELNGVIEHLKNQELQKPFIKTLIQLLKKDKNLLAVSNLEEYIISSLSSMVMTENFEVKKNNLPKVVSFVGPTGVGKTTSIAKLAAISKIIHNLNVGIISIDSYRLGAIDQLRIFSEISNIDMLVAYEPGDMKEQLKKLKNKDIVFIDTIGRSHKNTQELRKMKKFLDGIKVDETLLVLSSTSSTKYLYEAAEKFKVLDYSSLVFTKLDEASSFGNLFNVSINYDTPIQFLTNGQIIPDDILSADPDFIAKIIYTGAIN